MKAKQISNECLNHKLHTKPPSYSGYSLLLVSYFSLPAHSLFLIFSLASWSSSSGNVWLRVRYHNDNTTVASILSSLPLSLLTSSHRLPVPVQLLCSPWSCSFGSLCHQYQRSDNASLKLCSDTCPRHSFLSEPSTTWKQIHL